MRRNSVDISSRHHQFEAERKTAKERAIMILYLINIKNSFFLCGSLIVNTRL